MTQKLIFALLFGFCCTGESGEIVWKRQTQEQARQELSEMTPHDRDRSAVFDLAMVSAVAAGNEVDRFDWIKLAGIGNKTHNTARRILALSEDTPLTPELYYRAKDFLNLSTDHIFHLGLPNVLSVLGLSESRDPVVQAFFYESLARLERALLTALTIAHPELPYDREKLPLQIYCYSRLPARFRSRFDEALQLKIIRFLAQLDRTVESRFPRDIFRHQDLSSSAQDLLISGSILKAYPGTPYLQQILAVQSLYQPELQAQAAALPTLMFHGEARELALFYLADLQNSVARLLIQPQERENPLRAEIVAELTNLLPLYGDRAFPIARSNLENVASDAADGFYDDAGQTGSKFLLSLGRVGFLSGRIQDKLVAQLNQPEKGPDAYFILISAKRNTLTSRTLRALRIFADQNHASLPLELDSSLRRCAAFLIAQAVKIAKLGQSK